MTKWKEQLHSGEYCYDGSSTEYFISKEIIEKIIDDIPDETHIMSRDDIENGCDLIPIKEQLKDKWL